VPEGGTVGRKPRARGRRPHKRRQEILDAAARVFYEKGYDASSTQDIADDVGILKGSLYYYVETKEDFLFEVIKEAHSLAIIMLDEVRAAGGNAAQTLARLVAGHIRFYLDNRIKATVFFRDYPTLSPERRIEISSLGQTYRRFVIDVFERGHRDGTVNPRIVPSVASVAFTEMLNSIARWYDPKGPAKEEELIELYSTMLLDGLIVHSPDVSAEASGTASVVGR
jgi:AcrR family transcriptional regulator